MKMYFIAFFASFVILTIVCMIFNGLLADFWGILFLLSLLLAAIFTPIINTADKADKLSMRVAELEKKLAEKENQTEE